MLLHTASIERASAKRNSNREITVSRGAETFAKSFSKSPQMVKYIATKWKRPGEVGWFLWHARFLRALPGKILAMARGERPDDRGTPIGMVLAYNRRYFSMERHKRSFSRFDDTSLADMKFLYFPMHKETDLTLVFQAPVWHDQRFTIQLIASCLPAGYCLLVREHRFNFGHRTTQFYKDLANLPNVILVDPFDSQFKYVRNADLIVTENSSTGLEGLLFGRRVVTIADNFYDGAGLTTRVSDPSKLGSAIIDALARPAVEDPEHHKRGLCCMYDAEQDTTFSGETNQLDRAFQLLEETFESALSNRRRTLVETG